MQLELLRNGDQSNTRDVFPVDSVFSKNVKLIEVAPGVVSLRGAVDGHRERKTVVQWVGDNIADNLLNELRLNTAETISRRKILANLKRDKYLKGIRYFLQEPAYKPLYSILIQGGEGIVRLSGVVPSATVKSYLETIVWLMPGVRRVINLVDLAKPDELRIDQVVMQAADSLSIVQSAKEAIDLRISTRKIAGLSAVAAGNREVFLECSASLLTPVKRRIENIAWAVPEVRRVTTQV